MKRKILTKRVYESPSHEDGTRILVDHIWPRGLTKTAAALDLWIKEVAPSSQLRKWFDHRPERWLEFKKRYDAELDNNQAAVTQFTALSGSGPHYAALRSARYQSTTMRKRSGNISRVGSRTRIGIERWRIKPVIRFHGLGRFTKMACNPVTRLGLLECRRVKPCSGRMQADNAYGSDNR